MDGYGNACDRRERRAGTSRHKGQLATCTQAKSRRYQCHQMKVLTRRYSLEQLNQRLEREVKGTVNGGTDEGNMRSRGRVMQLTASNIITDSQ